MEKKLGEIAEIVGGNLLGDASVVITGVASIKDAKSGDITLLADRRFLHYLGETRASCVIVPPGIKSDRCAIIETKNPWEAMSKLLLLFVPPKALSFGIDESVHIGEGVGLGEGVNIGYHSYIGDKCKIADGVVIFPLTYIGEDSSIGKESIIYPNVTVREKTVVGQRVIIHSGSIIGSDGFGYVGVDGSYKKIPQVGKVIIEDDVEIGANVAIDRGTIGATIIRRGTKIDNLVHVAHNVVIGENSLIVAQVGIAGSTEIGKNCILAGQAGIVEHVKLGDGVVVGAQSGVTKSIPPHTKVSGYPARLHSQSKRAYAALSSLPELLKKVGKLEREMRKFTPRNG